MGTRVTSARSAYTLVEVLAVVVLLALVATLVAPGVVRHATTDPIAAAAEALRTAETFQRHRAIGRGAQLLLSSHGLGLRGDGALGGQRTLVDLPPGLSLRWLDHAGDAVSHLHVDQEGRSDDLQLVIDDGRHDQRYEVLGLTGEWCHRDLPSVAVR